MEFGRHISKGIWGLADKTLPVVYGIGFVWLVIRVLPEEEFGNFILTQEIFLIISGLATAFALQPLLKFCSEENPSLAGTVSAALILNFGFIVFASFVVLACSAPAGQLLHSQALTTLMMLVPAMLGASFFRTFALTLLQARFLVAQVFWTDAVHFLGAPALIWAASHAHIFSSAMDLVIINLISLTASSLAGLWFARQMLRVRIHPSRGDLVRVWDYGKYSLGGVVSSLFATKADSFILSAFTGPGQVGVYNSAKVFVRIFEMASQVVQMFILPAASKLSSLGEDASLKAVTEKAILFLTLGLVPVSILLLAFPELLVDILYGGRYQDAVPILRWFSLLTLAVPLAAVGSNVLMGLGYARLSFILGLQILAVSIAAFLVCIPPWGALGAGIGYVVGGFITALLTARLVDRYIPLRFSAILRRTRDVDTFLRKHLRQTFNDLRAPKS